METRTKVIQLPAGVQTYCDIGDAEKTLLLIHGLSFRQGLHPLIERLTPTFRVIALDLPFSERKGLLYEPIPEQYADLILDFIQALELKEPSFFGNSLGGTLGLMCCLKDPQALSKLVVRSPLWTRAQLPYYLRYPPLVRFHQKLSRHKTYVDPLLAIIYKISEKYSPQQSEAANGSPGSVHKDLFRQYQINPSILSKFLGNLIQVEIREQLHAVPNKTLVLWGEKDTLTSSIWGARLNQILPDANFQEMKGEYHNMATTDPKILAETISDFVLN